MRATESPTKRVISDVLTPVRSAQFKRDVRKVRARGKDLSKLRVLLESLIEQQPLAARHRDHPLRGIWKKAPGSAHRTRLAPDLPRQGG